MLKKLYSLLSIIGICTAVQAQGPTVLNDLARVYDTVSDADSVYLFYTPKPDFTAQEMFPMMTGLMVQEYVSTDTVTIYGVAITFRNRDSLFVYDYYTNLQGVLMDNRVHNTGEFYTLQMVDTVTFNRSHPRYCWFKYESESGKDGWVVPCYELYFDTPLQINRLSDTFFVGQIFDIATESSPLHMTYYGGRYDVSIPPHTYYKLCSAGSLTTVVEYCSLFNFPYLRNWGLSFPIIGLRCGAMPSYRLAAYDGYSAVVSWRNAELGTLYNLRLVGSDGSDTTFYTSDTSFTLTQLDSNVYYNVMLRRQCHFATSNYDTTVSSPWLDYIALYNGQADSTGIGIDTTSTGGGIDTTGTGGGIDTTGTGGGIDTTGTGGNPTEGIMRADGDSFSLTPNPARSSVLVTLPATAVGGRLSLCDLAGRELESHTVQGPSLELDVSTRAAGVYLVKLVTPRGVSSRRLVVE